MAGFKCFFRVPLIAISNSSTEKLWEILTLGSGFMHAMTMVA